MPAKAIQKLKIIACKVLIYLILTALLWLVVVPEPIIAETSEKTVTLLTDDKNDQSQISGQKQDPSNEPVSESTLEETFDAPPNQSVSKVPSNKDSSDSMTTPAASPSKTNFDSQPITEPVTEPVAEFLTKKENSSTKTEQEQLAEYVAELPDIAAFNTMSLEQRLAILLPIYQLAVTEKDGIKLDLEEAEQAVGRLILSLQEEELLILMENLYALSGMNNHSSTDIFPPTAVYTEAAPLIEFPDSDFQNDFAALHHTQSARLKGKQNISRDFYDIDDTLTLHKSVEKVYPNDDSNNEYELTLEAFTTEKLLQDSERERASDIVLVVDESQRMRDYAGFTPDNVDQTMHNAFTAFVDYIAADAGAEKEHRIGYVTFSREAANTNNDHALTNNYQSLKSDFNQDYQVTGRFHSQTEDALNRTQNIFNNAAPVPDGKPRNKVVIFITASSPSDWPYLFDTTIADNTVRIANNMKNGGTTFYSIGLFEGADNSVTHGDEYHYAPNFTKYSTGKPNSYWQKPGLPNTNRELVDLPAQNRFMNYLSSNYFDSGQTNAILGLRYNRVFSDWQMQNRFTINHNMSFMGTRGYYLTGGLNHLENALHSISTKIERPPEEFGNQIKLQDTLSEYYSFPEGFLKADIHVYTQACTGLNTANNQFEFSSTLNELFPPSINKELINISGNDAIHQINVSGFNFDNNYCTANPKPDGSYGNKLVIKFKIIKEGEGNFGGGKFAVNNYLTSGAYVGNQSEPLALFPECTVDEPIHFAVYKAQMDYGMYLGNLLRPGRAVPFKNQASSTDDFLYPDGKNNRYVDIYYTFKKDDITVGHFMVPAGNSASLTQGNQAENNHWLQNISPIKPESDIRYDVEVRMFAAGTPFSPNNLPAIQNNDHKTSIGIYVYHPTVELTDSTVAVGTTVNLKERVNEGEAIKIWTLGSNPTNPNNIPVPDPADRPMLIYEYFDENNNKISNPENYIVNQTTPIRLKITLDLEQGYNENGLPDGEDVTNRTFYKKNDTAGSFIVPIPHFTIFATKGSIHIKNSLPTSLIYHLEGQSGASTSGFSLDVIVGPNETLDITDLPYGTYTIEQNHDSIWQYSPIQPKQVTLSNTIPEQQCEFNNALKNQKWFSSFDWKQNLFNESVLP